MCLGPLLVPELMSGWRFDWMTRAVDWFAWLTGCRWLMLNIWVLAFKESLLEMSPVNSRVAAIFLVLVVVVLGLIGAAGNYGIGSLSSRVVFAFSSVSMLGISSVVCIPLSDIVSRRIALRCFDQLDCALKSGC